MKRALWLTDKLVLMSLFCVAGVFRYAAAGEIQMVRVDTASSFEWIVNVRHDIDMDHDGSREFVLSRDDAYAVVHVYEATSDDVFNLVHLLDLADGDPEGFAAPLETGDSDADGLSELFLTVRHFNSWSTRIYESPTADTQPSELIWGMEFCNSRGPWIVDLDLDGQLEFVNLNRDVVDKFFCDAWELSVFENIGDNSYQRKNYPLVYNPAEVQIMIVAEDLDQDGRDEILYGVVGGGLAAVESTGDDVYENVWTHSHLYDDGHIINANVMIDGGDLDGDGKREFLVGGKKTVSAPGPSIFVISLFEAVADNEFEIVGQFTGPQGLEEVAKAAVADVDGDGWREIVIGSGPHVWLFGNTGDDQWTQIWEISTADPTSSRVGFGDHDRDGKDEVIITEATTGLTGVYEIAPEYAADADGDDRVDVIDNCPATWNPDQQDVDADTVGDACDNCAQGFNPGQGPAVFAPSIVAADEQNYAWAVAVDVVWVRGPLGAVASYTVDVVDTDANAAGLRDNTVPAIGSGFYYVVRHDCGAASWQTSLGTEPARDIALP